MAILLGFLTFILVVNCLFLILLVLIQLPKKEAGAGIAFGGGATDALFGAGSGNALTKLTKYSASIFVGMSLLLSVLNLNAYHQSSRRLEQELSRQANAPAASPAVPALPKAQLPPLSTPTNPTLQTLPESPATNLMSKPASPGASTAAPVTPLLTPPAVTTPAPAPAKK